MYVLLFVLFLGCGTTPSDPEPPAATAATEARIATEMLLLNWGEVKYVGEGDKPDRTQDEALALAADLVSRARANPEAWPDLLREYSDSPLTSTGGRIESWPREQVPRDFSAILGVEVGAFTEPLDTHLGVVVLRRVEPLGASMLSARRLVVAYEGANRAPGDVTRTWPEAKVHADDLAKKAAADPGGFEALVKAESDGWDAERGGMMGTWTVETARWPLVTEVAIASVDVGGVSAAVRTPFGYEIYKRLEPEPATIQLAGAHLLISHASASSPRSDRSRDEAKALAHKLAEEAKADPLQFGVLTRKHSDDGSAERGGDLGAWKLGKLPDALEQQFLEMHFDEVAGPVETEYGFHVLKRRKSPADMAVYYRVPTGDPSEEEEMPEGAEYGVPGMDPSALPPVDGGHDHDDGGDHADHDH